MMDKLDVVSRHLPASNTTLFEGLVVVYSEIYYTALTVFIGSLDCFLLFVGVEPEALGYTVDIEIIVQMFDEVFISVLLNPESECIQLV